MAYSVVISGPLLDHLLEHSHLIASMMESPNVPGQIELTADVLPSGKHDVLFLQAWVDGEPVGEFDRKTKTLSLRTPFKEPLVYKLLDYLGYANSPETLSNTFLHSGIIVPKGTLTLDHGHGRPVASVASAAASVEPREPGPHYVYTHDPNVPNIEDNNSNYENDNDNNNANLNAKNTNNNNNKKHVPLRFAYQNPNNNYNKTPWAKRSGTKNAKLKRDPGAKGKKHRKTRRQSRR